MGLKKLARIMGVRKWLVIGAALVGAMVGYLITTNLNEARHPAFDARAHIKFQAAETERSRDVLIEDIAEAEAAAVAANQDAISEGLGTVSSNPQAGLLIFSARAREESLASERVEAMRAAYLDFISQDSAEDRQGRLDEIVAEAATVLARLEVLDPTPEEEPVEEEPALDIDPEVAARLDVLDALVTSLTAQHTRLEVDLILAEAGDERAGDPEAIRTELGAVSDRLEEIYSEIAEISAEHDIDVSEVTGRQDSTGRQESEEPTEPTEETRQPTTPSDARSPEEVENQWTIEALEARYEELAAEYEALFIQDDAVPTAELVAVEVTDLTPSRTSVGLFTALGLLAGAIAALALAFGEAALSGRVYVLPDVSPLNGLTEIPSARSLNSRRPRGWLASISSHRVEGVHRIRIALLGMKGANANNPVVGLTRIGVDHLETLRLATDLGRRLIASGSSVLVLDLDFEDEYPDTGNAPSASVTASISRAQGNGEGIPGVATAATKPATVAELIEGASTDPEAATAEMKSAFSEVTSIESFRFIRSGFLMADPADVVFTDAFQLLLRVAREQADLVLIVAPAADDHATISLQQRLDGLIAVSPVGRVRRSSLMRLAEPGNQRGIPVGVVLVTKWVPERSLLTRKKSSRPHIDV